MTPRLERARLILRSGLASYRGYLVVRNVVANLAQGVEVGSCWFDFFVFHACPLTGSKNQANTFSLFCGMVVIGELPDLTNVHCTAIHELLPMLMYGWSIR